MERVFHIAGYEIDWRFSLLLASLIMIRMIMITTTIPFLTGKPAPGMVKIGLALSLLFFLFPYLSPESKGVMALTPIQLVTLYFKEAFYGLAIGFTSSIVFHGIQASGLVIDNQRGAAQARMLIPQFQQESSVFGQFQFQLGLVLFLAIGGHIHFFNAVIGSYDKLPLLGIPPSGGNFPAFVDELIHLTGEVVVLSVQLCAPVLISIFIADVILGTISRTAPAINVWELGFIIRGVLGVFVVFLALGLIVSQMERMTLGMVGQVQRVIDFLSGLRSL
ncbi:MAG: flagellar biosynthetic protein FliR [Deltaproteobacteria bacterium]|nr:flagellar biosynthetic protein FliR [Deltaproteobacteria bacterium]